MTARFRRAHLPGLHAGQYGAGAARPGEMGVLAHKQCVRCVLPAVQQQKRMLPVPHGSPAGVLR